MARGVALDSIDLGAASIDERLALVGFGADDVARLAASRRVLEDNAEMLAGVFFAHLEPLDEARGLFADRGVLGEARRLKREHIAAMASGAYGTAYAEERARLGALYGHTALPARLFLGAFSRMITRAALLLPGDAVASLSRLAVFDVGIIVDVLIAAREEIIRSQAVALRELSTPVLQVRPGLLVAPVIGAVDNSRAMQLTENLLAAIRSRRARAVVIDVTGVAVVDTRVANHLLQMVSAARLMGASVIVTGIAPVVAHSLIVLGVDVDGLHAVGDLEGGIEAAEVLLAAPGMWPPARA